MSVEFLKDKLFLDALDDLKIKELYARLTILSWSEEYIKEIQGQVTSGGSLNLDGGSSVRRTGSLNLYADKRFNDLESIDTDIAINRKIKIEIGIKNTVPGYQDRYGEIVWFPLGYFVLSDVSISHDESGVNISLSYKDKMCLLNGDFGGVIPAAVTFSEMERVDENGITIIEYPTIYQIIVELVNHFGNEDISKIIISDLPTEIKQPQRYAGINDLYYVALPGGEAIRYFTDYEAAEAAAGGDREAITTYVTNDDIGYIMTDFTYPGELTCNPGETVTGILDKIVTLLGNYEYFYDVDGLFHFQEIKNYLNTSYASEILTKNASPDYQVDFSRGESTYTFSGARHVLNTNNSPVYGNVKNDFVVWGKRKAGDGSEFPIRYHLAIDKRPRYVGKYNGDPYYGKHENVEFYYDELNDLRARINPDASEKEIIYTKDYREELYYQGLEAEKTGTASNYYYTELSVEWPKIYDLKNQKFYDSFIQNPAKMDFFLDIIDSSALVGKYSVENIGRRSLVVQEDEINCIFEKDIPDLVFINTNDPDAEEKEARCDAIGQDWYLVDDMFMGMLSGGGAANSAYYRVTDLLYQNTTMNNAVSLTTLPLYYLEPNTRITINDEKAGIYGDYMISSISLPIDVGGMMDISAYKCLQKI